MGDGVGCPSIQQHVACTQQPDDVTVDVEAEPLLLSLSLVLPLPLPLPLAPGPAPPSWHGLLSLNWWLFRWSLATLWPTGHVKRLYIALLKIIWWRCLAVRVVCALIWRRVSTRLPSPRSIAAKAISLAVDIVASSRRDVAAAKAMAEAAIAAAAAKAKVDAAAAAVKIKGKFNKVKGKFIAIKGKAKAKNAQTAPPSELPQQSPIEIASTMPLPPSGPERSSSVDLTETLKWLAQAEKQLSAARLAAAKLNSDHYRRSPAGPTPTPPRLTMLKRMPGLEISPPWPKSTCASLCPRRAKMSGI